MTENLKNEHAASLGRLKKGKLEKPSSKKAETCRKNFEKAREALKIKRELDRTKIAPSTSSQEKTE